MAIPVDDSNSRDASDARVRLAGRHLETARWLIVECLVNPAGDAAAPHDVTSEAALALRSGVEVMDRIGWPGDARTQALLEPGDLRAVGWAAMAAMGAAAEAIDEASRAVAVLGTEWDADQAVADLERIIALLDTLEWPPGSTRGRITAPASAGGDLVALPRELPVPLWITDAAGRMVFRNRRAAALGGDPDHPPVHPDDRESLRAAEAAARAEHRSFHADVRLGADGRAHRVLATPRFTDDGAFAGHVAVAGELPEADQREHPPPGAAEHELR